MGCVWMRIWLMVGLISFILPVGVVNASVSEWDRLVRVGTEDELVRELGLDSDVAALFAELDIHVSNRELIHLLNESDFSVRRFSFRTDALVYLGRWVLHYEPEKLSLVRDFSELGVVFAPEGKLDYVVPSRHMVQGALKRKHLMADGVKQVIRDEVQRVTELPADFTVAFKQNVSVDASVADEGEYSMFVPAVLTEGYVVYADVYLEMKGKERKLLLKNKLKEKAGAWLPVGNRLVVEKLED